MADQHSLSKRLLTKSAAGAFLAIVLAGGVSCDLFETRTPNDPGSNTFPCESLDAAENVYVNIERAYGRGDGLPCYLSSLNDSMVFDFDDTDSLENVGQYLNWRKDIEQQDAQRIASGATSFFLQLSDTFTVVLLQSDVQRRRYAYEIQFKGSAIPDTLFQGLAEITVRRNAGGQWLVGEWVDRRDPGGTTSRTWGYLRQAYRTGF